MASPEQLATAWRRVRDEAPAHRNLGLAFYATVNVNSDAAQGQLDMERFIERYYDASFAAMSKRQGCFAGTADACVEWLAPFLDQGVEHLVLRLASGDQETQFQRVATELLPRLRELRPG